MEPQRHQIHLRNMICSPRSELFREGISQPTWTHLIERSPHLEKTGSEEWYHIWAILFPHILAPATPCKPRRKIEKKVSNKFTGYQEPTADGPTSIHYSDQMQRGYESFTDAKHTQKDEIFTDSGYGSTQARTLKAYSNIQTGQLASIQEFAQDNLEVEWPIEIVIEDDQDTQFSDTSSLRNPKIEEYVTHLADELYNAFPSGFNETDLARISDALPSLLKEFALRLGDDGTSTIYGQLKYLIYRYWRYVKLLV
jgi:hypothetical protein